MSTTSHQAIRFVGLGEVELVEVEAPPPPGPGDVTVQPLVVGVCGTDLHVLHGAHPGTKPPAFTGHEVIARVTAVGDGVAPALLDRVMLLNPLVAPRPDGPVPVNVQEGAKVIGFGIAGLARTAANVAAAQLIPVPVGLAPEDAVLAEPLAVGVHAAKRVGGRLDEVLIVGSGPIGLCVLAAVKTAGAGRVTVIDPVDSKRDRALRFGANRAVDVDEPLERRYTAVFDCVAARGTLRRSAELTLGGGAVVVMGVPSAAEVWELPLARMQRYEVDLLGSGMYTPVDLEEALALIADGRIDISTLRSATVPFTQAPRAYALAEDPETVKVVISLE